MICGFGIPYGCGDISQWPICLANSGIEAYCSPGCSFSWCDVFDACGCLINEISSSPPTAPVCDSGGGGKDGQGCVSCQVDSCPGVNNCCNTDGSCSLEPANYGTSIGCACTGSTVGCDGTCSGPSQDAAYGQTCFPTGDICPETIACDGTCTPTQPGNVLAPTLRDRLCGCGGSGTYNCNGLCDTADCVCGDGTCDPGEDCTNCPADCGPCSSNGQLQRPPPRPEPPPPRLAHTH